MKRTTLLSILSTMFITSLQSSGTDMKLPQPSMKGGLPFGETVAARRSVREFNPDRNLTTAQLSELLWTACGVNRPADDKRTNPTALGKHDIDLYLFTTEAVYKYEPATHSLTEVAPGDHRSLMAGGSAFKQDFVEDAPITLLMVSDINRFGMPGDERAVLMGAMDAGIVSENINLFCAANGLATVPRATMDTEAIKKLLKLTDGQIPMLNNPVGFAR